MESLQGKVMIVGEIPCSVCSEPMSQRDVDNQEAILTTNEKKLPFCNVIAHLKHFYLKVNGQHYRTNTYELNMAKLALASMRDRGKLDPDSEKRALTKIAELEKKFKQTELGD